MKSKNVIKRFLVASTPEKLETEQLRMNTLFNTSFDYEIVYAAKKWYAWFEIDVQLSAQILKNMRGRK